MPAEEIALLAGMMGVAAALAGAAGWLAVVGLARWRRGTPGGRWAMTAAAMMLPFAANLAVLPLALVWMQWVAVTPDPPAWVQWSLNQAFAYTPLLFAAAQGPVALAGRAALFAVGDRTAADRIAGGELG